MNIKKIIREEIDSDWDFLNMYEGTPKEILDIVKQKLKKFNTIIDEHGEDGHFIIKSGLLGDERICVIEYIDNDTRYNDRLNFTINVSWEGEFRVLAKEKRKITDRNTFNDIDYVMEWIFEYVMLE